MKRGFTLIEMLIVVALIATLMGIVFRLSSVSADESARVKTVVRLSMLENCLAGYYAANGGYPPVRLHASRDIYLRVDEAGEQLDERNENIWDWYKENRADHGVGSEDGEEEAWEQVQAACLSQPVACAFPYNATKAGSVNRFAQTLQSRATGGGYKNYGRNRNPQYELFAAGFDALNGDLGRFNGYEDETSWTVIKIFKFGLMSFLLPRLQLMMGGDESLYNDFKQWTENNSLPSNPLTGGSMTWNQIVRMNDEIRQENESNKKSKSSTKQNNTYKERQTLASIPSQAACARWMPNLRLMCKCSESPELEDQDTGYVFYGVQVAELGETQFILSDDKNSSPPHVEVFVPPGNPSGSVRGCYMLDSVTVQDGWGNEIYYYSPTPHQKYQLWSAGKNGRTFPPWVPRSELSSKGDAIKCVAAWTADDIIGLSN